MTSDLNKMPPLTVYLFSLVLIIQRQGDCVIMKSSKDIKEITQTPCMGGNCRTINDHLMLGAIINPPFLYECAIYNMSKCDKPGIEMELLILLSNTLNFTFELVDSRPSESSNLSSYEVLQDNMLSGAVNMSASFVNIRENNMSFVYSQPLLYNRRAYLMKTPRSAKIEFLLTLPFSPTVWVCFFSMVASYFIALTVIAMVFKDAGKFSNISHNAWTILASLVKPVGSHRYKQHAAVRALMISWQLGKMVVLSLYSASLVGFIFIAGDPALPFNTTLQMLEMVKQKELQLAIIKDQRFGVAEWKNTSMEEVVDDALNINPPLTFNTSEQAVKYVSEHYHVVLGGFDTTLDIWVRIYNVCDVLVITDSAEGYQFRGYQFHKQFAYIEQIQRSTSQLAGSFYMKRLYQTYVGLTDQCAKKKKEKGKKSLISLSIAQLQGTFWVLALGAIAGSGAVFGEFMLYKRARRKLKQRHRSNVESLFYSGGVKNNGIGVGQVVGIIGAVKAPVAEHIFKPKTLKDRAFRLRTFKSLKSL